MSKLVFYIQTCFMIAISFLVCQGHSASKTNVLSAISAIKLCRQLEINEKDGRESILQTPTLHLLWMKLIETLLDLEAFFNIQDRKRHEFLRNFFFSKFCS